MDPEVSVHLARINQAIARLERKTDFILKELKLESVDNPENTAIPPQYAEVQALLKQGKKLQAILAYRKLTNLGANEAQIAVEKIERGVSPE
jgi:ribosomal protein L7/L12